jgi:hypothetical protein
MSSETPSRGVGRQKGTTKVGAFEIFKFSQVWDESTQGAQEEQRQPSDWQKEKIWTIEEFTSRRSSEGACRKRRPTAIGSHEEISTVVGSGGVAHSLTSGRGISRENCGSIFLDREIEEP